MDARIILEADTTSSSINLFNSLGWLPFHLEANITNGSLLFNRIAGLTPEYIKETILTNADIHNKNTRFSRYNFRCPFFNRKTEGGKAFTVRAIKLWNSLRASLPKNQTLGGKVQKI